MSSTIDSSADVSIGITSKVPVEVLVGSPLGFVGVVREISYKVTFFFLYHNF